MTERLDDPQRADKRRVSCSIDDVLAIVRLSIEQGNVPNALATVRDALESARAQLSARSAGTRLYWLVESAAFTPRRYWTTNQHRANSWEIDPAKAIRYATQEEAMRVVMMLNEECEACEHMDCSGPEPELVLDKPAQIGSTRFGVGVKWSTVIDRAQREHEYQAGRTLQSARTAFPGAKVAMKFKQQRDECAEALRALAAVVESNFPMPAGVHPGSPLDKARKALAEIPTYEQQLRNIFTGCGFTDAEFEDAMKATMAPTDSRAHPK